MHVCHDSQSDCTHDIYWSLTMYFLSTDILEYTLMSCVKYFSLVLSEWNVTVDPCLWLIILADMCLLLSVSWNHSFTSDLMTSISPWYDPPHLTGLYTLRLHILIKKTDHQFILLRIPLLGFFQITFISVCSKYCYFGLFKLPWLGFLQITFHLVSLEYPNFSFCGLLSVQFVQVSSTFCVIPLFWVCSRSL